MTRIVPKSKTLPAKTADELYPPKSYAAIDEIINDQVLKVLKTKLRTFDNTIGFSWFLQDDYKRIDNSNWPIFEDTISSNDYMMASNKLSIPIGNVLLIIKQLNILLP